MEISEQGAGSTESGVGKGGWAGQEVRGGGGRFPKESQRTEIKIQNKAV